MSDPPHQTGASSSLASFFPYATGTTVNAGTFIGSYVAAPDDDSYKYLTPLYNLVSLNAILNQGGRADEVRCYPGTREEVLAKIEGWRTGGHLLDRFIFWLSGPAGAGKSAIVQTVAERCIEDSVAMLNFFFFRPDGSRNHVRSLVPTLLFQLFKIYPSLRDQIINIIRDEPVVFQSSLASQFQTLIINPVSRIRRGLPSSRPILLLVDGLDECETKADQLEVLRVLHRTVSQPNSPFIALVASRAESQIVMTFNSLGTFSGSIFLDDLYRPEEDVRLYVRAELSHIKRTHPLRHTLGPGWPVEDHVDAIVSKSSGQFIYAATVIRFVSNPSKSPHASMQTTLGIRPAGKRAPFAEIDALYWHILSQVDDWDMVRDVITLDRFSMFWGFVRDDMIAILRYDIEDIESSLIDLAPILRLSQQSGQLLPHQGLHFYHASFNDFLGDSTRAGNFYVDTDAVATQMLHKLRACVCNISFQMPSMRKIDFLLLLDGLLEGIKAPTVQLTLALQQLPVAKEWSRLYRGADDIYHPFILSSIERLYRKSDWDTGTAVLRSWVTLFYQIGAPASWLSAWDWTIPG